MHYCPASTQIAAGHQGVRSLEIAVTHLGACADGSSKLISSSSESVSLSCSTDSCKQGGNLSVLFRAYSEHVVSGDNIVPLHDGAMPDPFSDLKSCLTSR